MEVTHTQHSDWKYVSEGGATIVFSYVGPPNPRFDGTVLRLRKVKVLDSDFQFDKDDVDAANEPDDPSVEFQHRCMEKLIPSAHLPSLTSVVVNGTWLQGLSDTHNACRPVERRAKDRIDVHRRKAVLATDLVGGSWLAIEIKPKWGFLPSPFHLSPETEDIKARHCRFCMHSQLKVSHGETASLGYCPLDLFSRDRVRVERAVNSLWNAWVESKGAVNNLRAFVMGKMVKPDDGSYLESLAKELPQKEGSNIRDQFITAVSSTLMNSPVLRTLSTLQRNLDSLDIEGLSSLWARAFQEVVPASKVPHLGVDTPLFTCLEPTMDNWVEFINHYRDENRERDPKSPSTSDLRYYLLAYLLSATFKDCSIIVRLRRETSAPDNGKVTVIDLDPKSLSRLHKWELLDREIVDSFRASPGDSLCIDGENEKEAGVER